ncbi:DNA-binding transcriptional regulator, MerR family [Anaerosporobacter mobilis DSM 15930]|jgi:DNA-binding transcriptional MerR regulator|uniref:DNA-binding transcriptional regulator, MerR family n=1 Tax=Anaerosporobacter mobilis DSM 15930 TaxID=1120996 RepID=A0A1M7N600_9FIRM|nr:MerR family transcriptional regulator [Anaerosporobacter mobilis]SHM98448.1 DNA-binding transcriptional regulator, MerR family [Anaerosporobacter mobilis DSM 15930]
MKSTYSTSEIAKIIGIHPNTVRLYEEIEFISKPKRNANGYRIFTDLHIDQFRLARLALQVEVLQSGLRKQAINIIKTSARCDFDKALVLTSTYLENIVAERHNAEEAISIVEHALLGDSMYEEDCYLTRKETADYLHITIDTLRNWELNGLFTAKRKENGYRVYTSSDISTLKIIKSLRCANYSLASILRMLSALSDDPRANIRTAINTSNAEDDIITACDQLLTSLEHATSNANEIVKLLEEMKTKYK